MQVVVTSNVACGPVQVGDGTIAPWWDGSSRLYRPVRSTCTATLRHPAEKAAARRLTALSAIGAAGEFTSTRTSLHDRIADDGRIHLRSLDECLRRIAVYFADPDLATRTVQAFSDFQADGFAKLSEPDRILFTGRSSEIESA